MPKRKSCKKGYSRNKSTGRCRKIRKSIKSKSKRKCRSKKYLKLTKMSRRISKKLKKLSKKMSKASKNCRTRRKSGSGRKKSAGSRIRRKSAGRKSAGRKSAGRTKSAGRINKKYQVAVEYYAPPNFKKSKLAKLDIILESVMDEDDDGNDYYFYLVRLQAINRTNLLKYLKNIGNMKRILEIDEL